MTDAFQPGEPFSKDEILESLRRLEGESDRYLTGLPASIFVEPQREKWSPADHVRHLSKSTFPLVRALGLPRLLLRTLFGNPVRPSRSFPILRSDYLAKLAAGGKAGKFAPAPRPLPPDPEAWRREVMGRWRAAGKGLRSQIGRWPDAPLDRYRLPHPLLGKLTVREMLFFTVYHNAHHLNLVADRINRSFETAH